VRSLGIVKGGRDNLTKAPSFQEVWVPIHPAAARRRARRIEERKTWAVPSKFSYGIMMVRWLFNAGLASLEAGPWT
jgi:hypothetical protein